MDWMGALDKKCLHTRGTLKEIWEKNVEVEKWFDHAFQVFINTEVEIGSKK